MGDIGDDRKIFEKEEQKLSAGAELFVKEFPNISAPKRKK